MYFSCAQWFIEEEPNLTVDELFERAREQWMLSDLGDSGKPCLPDSIFDMKESHIVEGVYSVQMQYLLDICECELNCHSVWCQ